MEWRDAGRSGALRLFFSGIWTGALIAIATLMITAAGCRREQPPSPQVTSSKMNSVIFLDRHWVETDVDRIMEGVIET